MKAKQGIVKFIILNVISLFFMPLSLYASESLFHITTSQFSPQGAFHASLASDNHNRIANHTPPTASKRTKVFSDGSSMEIISQHVDGGDEYKHQLIMIKFDPEGKRVCRKSIKHKILYTYRNNKKVKETDFYDIITRPTDSKITREFIVKQYALTSGNPTHMTWVKYKQIDDTSTADLFRYLVLSYDHEGNPQKGIGEKWFEGEKIGTFFNWNKTANKILESEKSEWIKWENRIQDPMFQASKHF